MKTRSPFEILLDRIRSGCPWFEDEWRRYSSSSEFVSQYTLDHVLHFARFIAVREANNDVQLVRDGMALLMLLGDEGGDFIFSIIVGGVFEAIQLRAAELRVPAARFEPYLSGRYLEWWRAMEKYVREGDTPVP